MDPNLTRECVAVGCSEGFLGGSEHFEEFGGRTELTGKLLNTTRRVSEVAGTRL